MKSIEEHIIHTNTFYEDWIKRRSIEANIPYELLAGGALIHSWTDYYVRLYGPSHRTFRHVRERDLQDMIDTFKDKFGERLAINIYDDHLSADGLLEKMPDVEPKHMDEKLLLTVQQKVEQYEKNIQELSGNRASNREDILRNFDNVKRIDRQALEELMGQSKPERLSPFSSNERKKKEYKENIESLRRKV
jgi:hypothetical protein